MKVAWIAKVAGAALVFAGFMATASAQPIDTTPDWNGTTFISSFGSPNTATYGQTLTVPAGTTSLHNFSFRLSNSGGTTTQTIRCFVFVWDSGTQRAVGTPLYLSDPFAYTFTAALGSYQTLNCGGSTPISVTAGQLIVIGATVSYEALQPNSAWRWGALSTNTTYSGGQFVFFNNGTTPAQLTSGSWNTIAQDLAMTVGFGNSIPTLSEWGLILAASLVALFGFARLRRQR